MGSRCMGHGALFLPVPVHRAWRRAWVAEVKRGVPSHGPVSQAMTMRPPCAQASAASERDGMGRRGGLTYEAPPRPMLKARGLGAGKEMRLLLLPSDDAEEEVVLKALLPLLRLAADDASDDVSPPWARGWNP